MADFSENTQISKARLEQITHKIDEEDVSTDELIDMLDEAVKIGMQVCTQAQNNIDEQISKSSNNNQDGHK